MGDLPDVDRPLEVTDCPPLPQVWMEVTCLTTFRYFQPMAETKGELVSHSAVRAWEICQMWVFHWW